MPAPRSPCGPALALVATLALCGCGGSRTDSAPAATADVPVARRAVALVAGVPQRGNLLGDPDAPVRASLYLRLTEVDAGLDGDVLPAVLDRFVRTGRIRVQLRTVPTTDGLADEGADAAARVAQAAGLRDTRLWQFSLAFRALTTGTADDATLRRALRVAGVRDQGRVLRAARSRRVTAALARVTARQQAAVAQVPTLLVASGDGVATQIPLATQPSASSVVRRLGRAVRDLQRSRTSR